MRRVEQAGLEAIKRQGQPYTYGIPDFFEPVAQLKKAFSDLVEADDQERIAIIPSTSYGLANVANNLNLKKGDQILVIDEQFPSNIYPWMSVADRVGAEVIVIPTPESTVNKGRHWNEKILASITDQTALIAIGHVHWTDGLLFDLAAIRKKTWEHNALLVVDGTQSVGALPFSIKEFQPDALICSGYKWLMGPYSIGLAYYGTSFDGGKPIEENWINRMKSDDFAQLVNYQSQYRPKASRYSVGEQSNFILVPMMLAAIEQLLDWGVTNIQDYCRTITKTTIAALRDIGLQIAPDDQRSAHLFGIHLDDTIDRDRLQQAFQDKKVWISYRGNALRVGPNVYNNTQDVEKLVDCLKVSKKY